MKKKVAIIGATGMLGVGVYRALKDSCDLVLVTRSEKSFSLLDKTFGGAEKHRHVIYDLSQLQNDYKTGFQKDGVGTSTQKFFDVIGDVDAIINCAGLIKPHSTKDLSNTFFLNGAFPHILSWHYREKLIHIATDCVFDGLKEAPYTEESRKNPVDIYGLSKALGEPADSLVLRTSIVGPEIANFLSLIEWFRKQAGKEIRGFTNHFWNGITTLEYGNICKKIIEDRKEYPVCGTYHIFSDTLSKYEMLQKFKKKYNVDVTINEALAPVAIDRTLGTMHPLNKELRTPSFDEQLEKV